MKNSLFIPITSIVIKATCPINEPRLAASAPRSEPTFVSPLQNQRLADCSCGSERSKDKCVRVSHATPSTKAKTRPTRPTFPNTKALKARRSYISVTLTNGRRLKLRNAIRK